MIKNILLVGLGGGIGSILRYVASIMLTTKRFPYATLSINILGSFVIGLVLAFSIKNEHFANNWKLFLATGICGGFTTFSAFSLENMQLLQSGKTGVAFLYIALSVVLGIAATFAGYQLFKN
jgi:CrcB protein